jgi:hypothetical protein
MTNRSKTQKITQQYIYKLNKISSIAWKKTKNSSLLIAKSKYWKRKTIRKISKQIHLNVPSLLKPKNQGKKM